MFKKCAVILLSILMVLLASSCAAKDTIDEAKAKAVVNALCGAGWLGSGPPEGSNFETPEAADSQAFTIFYCMMEPGYKYPDEIPAASYEPLVQGCLGVSTDFLHSLDDYNADSNAYSVSVDSSVDMLEQQNRDYFKIDSIKRENGLVKVSYRILWGNMAGSGDGSDSAFEGYVLLKEDGDYYRVDSVTVTLNQSMKYGGTPEVSAEPAEQTSRDTMQETDSKTPFPPNFQEASPPWHGNQFSDSSNL